MTEPVPTGVAERMEPYRRAGVVGAVVALLAVIGCGVAVALFPVDARSDVGFGWGALAAAVALLVICAAQVQLWQRAVLAWADGTSPSDQAVRVSFWLHVLSYPVVLVGLYLCIEASALAGFSSGTGFSLGLAALLLILAQVTGAVQFLRTDGPPGTVPTHLRALMARIRAQR